MACRLVWPLATRVRAIQTSLGHPGAIRFALLCGKRHPALVPSTLLSRYVCVACTYVCMCPPGAGEDWWLGARSSRLAAFRHGAKKVGITDLANPDCTVSGMILCISMFELVYYYCRVLWLLYFVCCILLRRSRVSRDPPLFSPSYRTPPLWAAL